MLSSRLLNPTASHVTRKNPIKYQFFFQIFDNQVLNMLYGFKLTLKRTRTVDQPDEACKVETELNLNLKIKMMLRRDHPFITNAMYSVQSQNSIQSL